MCVCLLWMQVYIHFWISGLLCVRICQLFCIFVSSLQTSLQSILHQLGVNVLTKKHATLRAALPVLARCHVSSNKHTRTLHKYTYTHAHKHTPHLPPGLSPSSCRCVFVWGSTPLVLQFCALVRRPEGCVWVHLDRQCADHIWTHTCYCQVDIR